MEEFRFEEMRNAFMNEVQKIGKKNLEYAQKTGRPFHIGNLHITDGVRALGYSEDSAELEISSVNILNVIGEKDGVMQQLMIKQ